MKSQRVKGNQRKRYSEAEGTVRSPEMIIRKSLASTYICWYHQKGEESGQRKELGHLSYKQMKTKFLLTLHS